MSYNYIQNPDLELFANTISKFPLEYNMLLLWYMKKSIDILLLNWWVDDRNYKWKITFLTNYLWDLGIKSIHLNENTKNEK